MPLVMVRASDSTVRPASVSWGLRVDYAIEQQDPELRLQIGNRITDNRCRPAEPSRRAREAAHFDHGQKDPQLIERRGTRVG